MNGTQLIERQNDLMFQMMSGETLSKEFLPTYYLTLFMYHMNRDPSTDNLSTVICPAFRRRAMMFGLNSLKCEFAQSPGNKAVTLKSVMDPTEVPSYYALAQLITMLSRGQLNKFEFYNVIPPLFLHYWELLNCPETSRDQMLFDALFVAKHQVTMQPQTNIHDDYSHDKLQWMPIFAKQANYTSRQLKNMSTEEWCRYTVTRMGVLSVVCIITMILRQKHELSATEMSVCYNRIHSIMAKSEIPTPTEPEYIL